MTPDWREMGGKKKDKKKEYLEQRRRGWRKDGNKELRELRWGRSEARSGKGQDLESGD